MQGQIRMCVTTLDREKERDSETERDDGRGGERSERVSE